MLHTKFHGNRSTDSGEAFLRFFYHIWAWLPSWSCDQHHINKFHFYVPVLKSRDVIRSPDIPTIQSRSKVRIQFFHPDLRLNFFFKNCQKSKDFM